MANEQKERATIRLARIAKAGPVIVAMVVEVHQAGISCAKVATKSKLMRPKYQILIQTKPNQMKFSRFLSRYMDGDQHNSQIMTNLVCPPQFVSNQKLHSISAMKCSNDSNFDMFTMMKENALFLLELSSTNSRKFRFR